MDTVKSTTCPVNVSADLHLTCNWHNPSFGNKFLFLKDGEKFDYFNVYN